MVKSNVRYRFGEKIRSVREKKKLTLKEVAGRANVSESLVSQIERNKVSPSIDTMLAIAGVLEIDPEYLFLEYKRKRAVTITRKSERDRRIVNRIKYDRLSSMTDVPQNSGVEVVLIEIGRGMEKGDKEYGHGGKEFGVILEGEGELVYGAQTYFLKEGDSVSFSSNTPHILKNTGDGVLKSLWVITPPRMFL